MTNPVEPFRPFDKNEGSTILLELTHLDKDKALLVPTTLTYRIDDLTNRREVLDTTTVSTPGSTNTITITGAQNALFGRSQQREQRQVTVKAVDSAGSITKDIFIYTLIRIFTSDDRTI